MREVDGAPRSEAAERKFRARRINEIVKVVSGLLNTLAAAVIATSLIVPTVRAETAPNVLDRPGWVLIGLFLHVVGLGVLWFGMRPED